MLSRVRRQPLHAAKRARRHPQLHVPRPHVPRPHIRVPRLHVQLPRPQLHMPSSPVATALAFVARWRGGRETLSLERRRARTLLIGAIVFASVVLLTSFPIGGLLSQRSALAGTAHELVTVKAENQALARQVSDLSDPATVNDLARHDYGFVPKGQRVYDILPASSPSGSASAASGQVPLNGPPVVPGSARSQALIGVVAPVVAPSTAGATNSVHAKDAAALASSDSPAPPEPHSYWGRVVRSLEFWN